MGCDCTVPKKSDRDLDIAAKTKYKTRRKTKQKKMFLPSIDPSCLSKYAKVNLKCDLSKLTKNQQEALIKLRQASELMDEIFTYQSTGKSMTYNFILSNLPF